MSAAQQIPLQRVAGWLLPGVCCRAPPAHPALCQTTGHWARWVLWPSVSALWDAGELVVMP